jgi:hypothetical protein
MRFPPRNNAAQARDRAEQMRKRRAESAKLQELSPQTARMNVQLNFLPLAAPPHAAQSFVLYPTARAYFEYPCPYGDCAGVYDLNAEAQRVLTQDKKRVSGTFECTGTRSRVGTTAQPCGLRVNYSISVERS